MGVIRASDVFAASSEVCVDVSLRQDRRLREALAAGVALVAGGEGNISFKHTAKKGIFNGETTDFFGLGRV